MILATIHPIFIVHQMIEEGVLTAARTKFENV